MRTPPRSVRTCRRPHRKRARRREKTGSSRSRRCSCSTSKTQRPSPCKWKEPFPSSTPCCTGNPPQVAGQRVSLSTKSCSIFSRVFTFSVNFVPSCPGGRAVLCDGVRVWRRQLHQRGEEDAAAGVVNRRCH